MVFGVVIVSRLYRNLRALLRGGEGKGAVGRAADGFAVGKPLVFDARRWHAVFVVNFGGQRFADFGVAADADFACMIRLRLRVR